MRSNKYDYEYFALTPFWRGHCACEGKAQGCLIDPYSRQIKTEQAITKNGTDTGDDEYDNQDNLAMLKTVC